MRLVTWNVNSLGPRLARLLALLDREQPDVVCLQETKTHDDEFPTDQLATAGYVATSHGQRPYNGVATLSRSLPTHVTRGFPGDPTPDDARVLTTRFNDLTVIDVYVINGRHAKDPAYNLKLEWLAALHDWIADTFDPAESLIVVGDFNIAPDKRDVHDPARWEKSILFTEPERQVFGRLLEWGLVDLFRHHVSEGGHYTWWDYRAGAFHRGWGLRLDLILGTQAITDRCTEVRIDRNERRPT
ncbi:MAG: exodeoxyribonuclease III, partial [Acidimicrobiia bacterium]|nr:exodeoxyribonuclease III [Acidimicrobiia bacterium]